MSEITTEVHYHQTVELFSPSGVAVTNAVFPPVVIYQIPQDATDEEITVVAGSEVTRLVNTYRTLREKYYWRERTFFFQPSNPARIDANDQTGCFHLRTLKQVGESIYYGKSFHYLEFIEDMDRVVAVSKRDIHLETHPEIDDRDTVAYGAWVLQQIGGPWGVFGDLFKRFYQLYGWYVGAPRSLYTVEDTKQFQEILGEILRPMRKDDEEGE